LYLVKETFSYKLEIKKSTFIAFITPYDNFQPLRQQLKQQHPKSRHIVYAFRYLNEHNQIIENLSDDGEPKGSSAPPILVVRYFGGIRLGIGGLVRAYGNATKEVIKQANLIEYIAKELFTFETSYPLVGKYYLVKKRRKN
jgi:putative IMPACT (imprinted ancient) family translation regulator